jgi:hypothetical protein
MTQTNELKNRVEAKKLSLQAKIKELQADTQATSRERVKKLQTKLDSLNERSRRRQAQRVAEGRLIARRRADSRHERPLRFTSLAK